MRLLRILLIAAIGLVSVTNATAANPPPPSSCATPDLTALTTCFFDLTASPSTTQTPPSAVLNGGIFRVPGQNDPYGQGFIVGTGVFQPFVRIQEAGTGNGNQIEAGFNTDKKVLVLDNHNKGGHNWNHSIKLGDVPIVRVCDGGGSTGNNCKDYYEFLLDINEEGNSPDSGLSLDEFKIFTANAGDLTAHTGYDDTKGKTDFKITGTTERYDMDGQFGDPFPTDTGGDASILMDYRNFSGSGNGLDLQALVPIVNFEGVAATDYLYLYSKFGWTGTQCQEKGNTPSPCYQPDGTPGQGKPITGTAGSLNFKEDAGFEEWSIRKVQQTPVPSTAFLLGLGLAFMGVRRRA